MTDEDIKRTLRNILNKAMLRAWNRRYAKERVALLRSLIKGASVSIMGEETGLSRPTIYRRFARIRRDYGIPSLPEIRCAFGKPCYGDVAKVAYYRRLRAQQQAERRATVEAEDLAHDQAQRVGERG